MLTGRVHSVMDSLLLAQLNEGNESAFIALYDKYWNNVFDEAYKRTGHRDQAKDIAQEVFTAMWIRCSETPIDNLPAWLYIVTKNLVYKLFQEQERFTPISELLTELKSYGSSADALILEKELNSAYNLLVSSLPEQQRIIFKMRYQDDLTPSEIASKLSLSPKTVRNHLGRALRKLRTTFMLIQLLMIIGGFS
ncbi:MAG: sigma-70 family RNA polymerase sigma factor [Daejeonella sp.]|uniref:RNA polymerase sigma factor n=1 Tax=Daejeonella sp. TaxID=2805397 RepID=UPI00273463AD|nr:sigma-70 family RNA polymerase sigma factor [Daejeonella sp.]MDP3466685.1 sigma-70 family RNA polymerase sigma factor [Daejeonella sp.]